MLLTITIYFFYIRRRILNTLFENMLRAEETLEKWINRKIDSRVWESLDGPLRGRVIEMVQSVIDESLKGRPMDRDASRPHPKEEEGGPVQEDKR